MAKAFASASDTAQQKFELIELHPSVFSYSAAHDPNNGLIIGEEACLVVDTRATPKLAREFITDIRTVTDKPIRYVGLTHYHAVRTLGASAYDADWVVASQNTYDLIVQRGKADWDSEYLRFPRLFEQAEEIPGLTVPNVTFTETHEPAHGRRPGGPVHPSGQGSHQGRHADLAAPPEDPVHRRAGRGTLPALCWRRLCPRMDRYLEGDRGSGAGDHHLRPRPGADLERAIPGGDRLYPGFHPEADRVGRDQRRRGRET